MNLRMKNIYILALLFVLSISYGFSQTDRYDEIMFGDKSSEKKHNLQQRSSQTIKGGLGQSARVLLPIEGERVEGGNMTFRMKVDPEKQNYFTARFWGSDSGNSNILILFCEGKQIGYRHLGDYDMLDIANEDAPFHERFTYTTLPLPLNMTKGKTEIELSIRSTGYIFRYGDTFDKYQKPMKKPSKAIYKAYTHTNGYFTPNKNEKQGEEPKEIIRTSPGEEILTQIKVQVNEEIDKMLIKKSLNQYELLFLADAYYISWTNAFNNKGIIEKIIEATDIYSDRFKKNPAIVYEDSWVTVGLLCQAICRFVPEIGSVLDVKMENGQTRKQNWSDLFVASVDYAKTHRRQYTNQSMIVDLYLYHVNNALSIVDYKKALPNYQTLRYFYESMGLAPWLGKVVNEGYEKPLGENYYQLTAKGLTKELGFVGGYGEIVHWMNHIYNATGVEGAWDSRDPIIRAQMLKMFKARSYFRYPSIDNDGYKAMRAEAVVGWRDHGVYPGNILYGEKGYTREATPITVTASTLESDVVGYAQQMMCDNQFFSVVKEKMTDRGIHSTHTLLKLPDEYARIKAQADRNTKLPMSKGMPDVVFSDEEDGVIAIKNGDEILYASLYWRANYAINFLARVHYITPEIDRIATVFEDVKFTDSGLRYKRPERINLAFSDARNFYPDIKSAHTGEELPIAKIPDGMKYELGWENVYAGKGDFYTLRYGKYLIGMNCTKDKIFELHVPKAKSVIEFPSKSPIKETTLSIKPQTTIVLIVE